MFLCSWPDDFKTYYNLAASMVMRKLEQFNYDDTRYRYDRAYEKYTRDDCGDMILSVIAKLTKYFVYL